MPLVLLFTSLRVTELPFDLSRRMPSRQPLMLLLVMMLLLETDLDAYATRGSYIEARYGCIIGAKGYSHCR